MAFKIMISLFVFITKIGCYAWLKEMESENYTLMVKGMEHKSWDKFKEL